MTANENQDPNATGEASSNEEDMNKVEGSVTTTDSTIDTSGSNEASSNENNPAPVVQSTEPPEVTKDPEVKQEVTAAPAVVTEGVQDNTVTAQTPPTPPVETPVAPIVKDTETKPAVATELDVALDKMKTTGTKAEIALVNSLEAYLTGMRPRTVIDPETGARFQHSLWQTLRNVIQNSPEGEFKRLWSIVLAFAHEHENGIFNGRYIMRFAESWRHDLDELDAFQRLLNLINLTANPALREKGLRQVDLTRSLDKGFNEHGRGRLVSFYKS